MNKALENIIETGVNLLIAVGVIMLISTVWNLGRDTVITMEKQKAQQERAGEMAEFNELNGTVVEYARAVELVTTYAGDIDIYVDSTADGGAILISSKTGCNSVPATEGWNTVTKNDIFIITDITNRIGGSDTDYYTNNSRLIAEAQQLLRTDLTKKFGIGKWMIKVAVNNENVGNANGKKPEAYETVTGLRFQRIE